MDATNERRRRILVDLLDATFKKDIPAIGSFLTDDFAIWMAPSAREHGIPIPLEGRQTYLDFVSKVEDRPGMWKPRSYEVKQVYFDGDAAAMWVRFLGEFEGGYPYDNEYVFTFRFVGDKVFEKREFTDTAFIASQRAKAQAHAAAKAG